MSVKEKTALGTCAAIFAVLSLVGFFLSPFAPEIRPSIILVDSILLGILARFLLLGE